jgi:tetratricopeptide (TPR) repeat protein
LGTKGDGGPHASFSERGAMRLWVGNLGYYWWTLSPKDPGLGYVKTSPGTELICQEFDIPEPKFDYMIWCTNVVQNWDTLKANWSTVDRLPGKKAWWSFDNHIWHRHELRSAEHFDLAFLAHRAHLKPYREIDHHWLPLCVVQFSIDELIELLPFVSDSRRDMDFQFRGARYSRHTCVRENTLDAWFDRARELGFNCDYTLFNHPSDFAEFHSAGPLDRAATWLSSHASISAPIHNDLSTRFFDGIFFGQRVFIPHTVPDVDFLIHRHVQKQVGVIRIDNNDPSVLNESLSAARNMTARRRLVQAFFILFHHHINNRVVAAFNTWVGDSVLEIDYDRLIDRALTRLKGKVPTSEIYAVIEEAMALGAEFDDFKIDPGSGQSPVTNSSVYIEPRINDWNRFQQGVRQRILGNFKTAVEIFSELLETDPRMHAAARELGLTHFDSKSYKDALVIFRSLQALKYEKAETQYYIAETLRCLERFQEALNEFDIAVELEPSEIMPRYGRALTLMALNCFQDALTEFDTLLEMKPNDIDVQIQKGLLLRKSGKHSEALQCFRLVETYQPQNLDLLINIGISLSDNGRSEEALEYLDAALRKDPYNEQAKSAQSRIYASLTKWENAIRILDELICMRPDALELKLNKAIYLRRSGKTQFAKQEFEHILTVDPQNFHAKLNLSICLREQNDNQMALTILDDALRHNQQNCPALFQKALTLQKMQRFDEACTVINQILDIDPQFEPAIEAKKRLAANVAVDG